MMHPVSSRMIFGLYQIFVSSLSRASEQPSPNNFTLIHVVFPVPVQIWGKAAALQTPWTGPTKHRLLPLCWVFSWGSFFLHLHTYNIMCFYSIRHPMVFFFVCYFVWIHISLHKCKMKVLNPFLLYRTLAPAPCVQAITGSDISCCAKALLYTDSEMIVTPVIDNPKVQPTRHAVGCSTMFLFLSHVNDNSGHVCLVCLWYFMWLRHPCSLRSYILALFCWLLFLNLSF